MVAVTLRPLAGFLALRLAVSRVRFMGHAFDGILLPIFVYWVFSPWVAPNEHPRMLAGVTVFGATLLVMRGVGERLAYERVAGMRRTIHTAGITPDGYLVGVGIEALLIGALPLLGLAVLLIAADVEPPRSAAWVVPYVVFLPSAVGVGVSVASICRSIISASLAANLIALLVLTMCPLLYPAARSPAWVRPVVESLPFSLAVDLMADLWRLGTASGTEVVLLAGWSLVLTVAARRLFLWRGS